MLDEQGGIPSAITLPTCLPHCMDTEATWVHWGGKCKCIGIDTWGDSRLGIHHQNIRQETSSTRYILLRLT